MKVNYDGFSLLFRAPFACRTYVDPHEERRHDKWQWNSVAYWTYCRC